MPISETLTRADRAILQYLNVQFLMLAAKNSAVKIASRTIYDMKMFPSSYHSVSPMASSHIDIIQTAQDKSHFTLNRRFGPGDYTPIEHLQRNLKEFAIYKGNSKITPNLLCKKS